MFSSACKYYQSLDVKKDFALMAMILLIAMTGCGTWIGNPSDGDDDDNPDEDTAKVNLDIQGSDPDFSLLADQIGVTDDQGASIGSLILIDARIVVSSITIKSTQVQNDEKTVFAGPFLVDLLNNTVFPIPDEIEIKGGEYSDIELTLYPIGENEIESLDLAADDKLVGNNIALSGSFVTGGGGEQEFEMQYNVSETISLSEQNEISNKLSISINEVNSIILAFRLGEWGQFHNRSRNGQGTHFGKMGSGPIRLNESATGEAAELRTMLKNNVLSSGKYGKDVDGDRGLSKKEAGQE